MFGVMSGFQLRAPFRPPHPGLRYLGCLRDAATAADPQALRLKQACKVSDPQGILAETKIIRYGFRHLIPEWCYTPGPFRHVGLEIEDRNALLSQSLGVHVAQKAREKSRLSHSLRSAEFAVSVPLMEQWSQQPWSDTISEP